uniref:Uncharacterized protein n=1 Tax=Panagrolaimus davidi TaxID=227884 RepID=A0A914QI11_9BILA
MSDKNSNEERENADGSRPPTPDPAPNEFQFAEPAPPKRFQFLTGKFNHTSEIPKRMKDAHRREREKSNLMRKSCAHQSRAHDTINPMTEYNSENADDMSSSFNNSGMQLQGSSSRWNPPRYNDHNSTPNNDVSVRRVDERKPIKYFVNQCFPNFIFFQSIPI